MKSVVCLLAAGILFGFPPAGGASTLTIPGSGSCEAALRGVATVYEQSHPLAKVVVPPSVHSEGGIRQVIDGVAFLARVSRPLTPEEAGKGLTYRVFARDAVVFAVGAGVRTRNLTIRQAGRYLFREDRGVGATERGERSHPGPLPPDGGVEHDAPAGDVHRVPGPAVHRRGEGALLRSMRCSRCSGNTGTPSGSSPCPPSTSPASLIPALSLDGVAPTKENIAAGRYPVVIEYALVYRKDALPPEAREFIDFLSTPDGRKALSGRGLVPVER